MRAAIAVLLVQLLPLVARAERPVIGGMDAPLGKWPDVAAVYISGDQECTGTLIAPTVVITAGHCNDPVGAINKVLIGSDSLASVDHGEVISVSRTIEYPNSQRTMDVSILVLAKAATKEPRKIASGWASFEIKNGAPVAIVGYGAVDSAGPVDFDHDEEYINELQEATTTITDADCTLNADNGCVASVMPRGELGAGGMGVDTCPGDSGGPLYLITDFGTFLAGVTSRSYDDAMYWCSEGGIYVRPDKITDWIEEVTGVAVARGPEPTVPKMLSAVRGHSAEAMIDANDPKSDAHTYAITTQPKYAKAAVKDDGHLRICMDAGVVAMDSLTLSITDKTDATRTLSYTIGLDITEGEPADSCDVEDFDSGGCCDSGRSAAGSLPLGIGVLLLLRRRRR
jgi:endonuclease G